MPSGGTTSQLENQAGPGKPRMNGVTAPVFWGALWFGEYEYASRRRPHLY